MQVKELKRAERQQKRAERQKVRLPERWQVREKGESRRRGNSLTQLQDKVSAIELSSDESDTTCPKCGLLHSADNSMWIACDRCQSWFNLSCTNILNSKKLPDVFYCEK